MSRRINIKYELGNNWAYVFVSNNGRLYMAPF